MKKESMQLMKLPATAVLVSMVFLGGLVGCNLPASGFDPAVTASPPAQYETVAVILSETAAISTTIPTVETVNSTVTPALASATPSLPTKESPTPKPSPTLLCDLAGAGIPIDVTIPDDSRMRPGESFAKVWRLVNAGACTWTMNYAVTWFSGDNFGVRSEEPFNVEVAPGNSIDLSIDMVAPEKAGVYQSNWKLRNGRGDLFGIGPGGGAPFWVRIKVEVLETLTPTVVPPTLTATPLISSSGSATLKIGEGMDVDNGQVGTNEQVDVVLGGDETQMTLSPVNASKAALHGGIAPNVGDCQASDLSAQPILFGAELDGSYLCLQTSRGLPASLQIVSVDLANASVNINFTVWSVP
jgi:hypothetical protein